MIKINTNKHVAKTLSIGDMKPGQVFIYEGDYFIRGDETDRANAFHTTRLKDGFMLRLSPDRSFQVVSEVNMEVSV